MGSVTDAPLWYLMRGSGVVALVLLTAVFVLGVATSQRARLGALPRFATVALHRSLSLLAVSFLAVHVLTAVIDPYATVSFVQVLLPVPTGAYAAWVGLGALSLDLTLAVIVTSLLRHRISQRTWRAVHWLAYLSWPIAFLHSVTMGSDAATPWLLPVLLLCLGAVVAAVLWRVAAGREPHPKHLGASGGSA